MVTKNRTLGEFADAYETPRTPTIDEAGTVKVNTPIENEDKKRSDGTPYTVSTITVNGKKYRIPSSVIMTVKDLRAKGLKFDEFQVIKTGTTKDDTRYTVVPVQKVTQ